MSFSDSNENFEVQNDCFTNKLQKKFSSDTFLQLLNIFEILHLSFHLVVVAALFCGDLLLSIVINAVAWTILVWTRKSSFRLENGEKSE